MNFTRRLTTVAVATVVAVGLAACGSDSESTDGATDSSSEVSTAPSDAAPNPSDPGDADGLRVALVTPENAGDDGPTDNLIEGLDRAAADYGVEVQHIAATDPSAHAATLRNLANAGVDVIIVAFPQLIDGVKAVAADLPDTRFIHLYADDYAADLDNVQTIAFDTQGPSYLAGVVAATLSESGKIGFIGGTAVPQLNADFHAYEAGALATDPDVEITPAFVGDWGDPVGGQQVAQGMFDRGVDVVLAYAGGSSLGVVKAADETDALVIYDNNENEETANSVFALASQNYGDVLYRQLGQLVEGTWQAGHERLGLAEDATFLVESEGFPEVNDEAVVAAIAAAFESAAAVRESIIAGEVEVPFDPSDI
jgi:basic membrane protein A